jgi:hypothetical protein
MTQTKFSQLIETFNELIEEAGQVDRLIAADLPGESVFVIKWGMISKLIATGLTCQNESDAGNIMEMLTEELPSTIRYATKHAQNGPNLNAEPTIEMLERMLSTARNSLGDEVYRSMVMDKRR